MPNRKGRPLRWTEERLAALRRQMEPWMRRQTAERFYFTITGDGSLTREFQVSDDVCTKIVQQLIAEGLVQYRGASHLGYSWRGAAGDAVTLADLMQLAASQVNPDATAERGRRGAELHSMTESQFKDIKTVTNLIAKRVPGADGQASRVTAVWFGYDGEARAWELEAHVARWSDEQHRVEWERKAKNDGKVTGVWSPKLNAGRPKHLGAVKNLLDLAATHERIPRAARPEHKLRSPATEWQAPMKRMKARILRHDPTASGAMLDLGLRILALTATRRRELSFATTDWMAVRAEIEAAHEAMPDDTYIRQQRDNARYVWRRVMQFLGRPSGPSARVRVSFTPEHHWSTRQDTRRSLVPDGAITQAAAHATGRLVGKRAAARRGETFEYASSWMTRDGIYARSLVEGECGIADWITWSTAPADTLNRLGYPERAFINPTPEMLQGIRRATGKGKVPYLLAHDTLVGRLRLFSQLAGFAHENGDVTGELISRRYDFVRTDDLGALCDLRLVLAYSEWLREEADDEAEDSQCDEVKEGISPSVCDLAIHLAKVAAPYLEGRALARANRLEANGDAAAAAAAAAEAQAFRQAGFDLKAWGYKHKPKDATRKDIVLIAEAWAGSNHRSGWEKLDVLVELLMTEVERVAGLTIAEQLTAIREAAVATPRERMRLLAWQSLGWATAVRAAMLVNFVRKLPVRARAVSEMRVDWWEATLNGRRVEPWHPMAAVMANVPGIAMKTHDRDYRAPYIGPSSVGDQDHETGARRELVELWLRPHAARAFLLTEWREDEVVGENGRRTTERVAVATISSPYFFPAAATHGNAGKGVPRRTRRETGLRWSPPSISVHFERLVREHATALEINIEALDRLHGALRLHVVRLLFGHHNAPDNLTDTALMLHHSDPAITSRLYVGRSAAQTKFEIRRGVAPTAPPEVAILQQELAQERATVEELRRTAVEERATAHSAETAELVALLRESLDEQRRRNDALEARLRQVGDRILASARPAA